MAEPNDCIETLAGYEADVGYVREVTCGTTPPDSSVNYYDDGGTKRFQAFGHVQSFEPTFATNQIKKRGLGNRKITCNKHGKYDLSVSISYFPNNMDRLIYVLGDTPASGVPDHVPSSSFVRQINRVAPNAQDQWELYNMMKVNTFTIEASVDDAILFSEDALGQYLQPGDSKVFAGFQTVTVGELPNHPLQVGCDMLMFYEGDILITRESSEDVSTQFTGLETQATLTNSPMDWLLDGTNYEDVAITDLEVLVNGSTVALTAVNYTAKTVDLTVAPGGADIVVVNYHYVDRLFNVSDYSVEMAHNQTANFGISDGLAVAYEIVEGIFAVTGSLTTNFNSRAQYDQYVGDEYFHLIFGLGGLKDLYVKNAKWDNAIPPTTEEDLIAESLDYESEDVQLKDLP